MDLAWNKEKLADSKPSQRRIDFSEILELSLGWIGKV